MPTRFNTSEKNTLMDLFRTQFFADAPRTIKMYTGTQPALGGGSHSDTLLVTLTIQGWANASGGSIVMNATDTPTVVANGTVGWCRIEDQVAGGAVTIVDLSVTGIGGGGDLEISNTSLTTSDTVNITSLTINAPG